MSVIALLHRSVAALAISALASGAAFAQSDALVTNDWLEKNLDNTARTKADAHSSGRSRN